MRLQRIKTGPFKRFGDQYGHLIDSDHFMGRTAFDDLWMSKVRPQVKKGEKGFDLEIPLPGLKKEEISVSIENNHLMINLKKSESDSNESDRGRAHLKLEERAIELSPDIDQERISAKLEDGMLRVMLPQKLDKERNVKVVEIQ